MTGTFSPNLQVAPKLKDDFKLIHGIGPGIEKRLHSAGILTYTQLAELTPEQVIQRLENLIGLTAKRVLDQQWIEQAEQLAGTALSKTSVDRSERQHYATFTVELLLDEQNDVRRIRIMHIQTETNETWVGWDQNRLVDFFIQHGELHGLSSAETEKVIPASAAQFEPFRIIGNPRLEETRITSLETGHQSRILANNQPFEIDLSIDLSEVNMPAETEISYAVETYVKSLDRGIRQKIGETQGTINAPDIIEMKISNKGLQEGTYRINVGMSFNQSTTQPTDQPELAAILDAGLLRVY